MANNRTNRPAGRSRGEHSEPAARPQSRRAAVRAEAKGDERQRPAPAQPGRRAPHSRWTRRPGGQRTLQLFFRQASRYPLLTAAEEVELAKRIERGDLEAKERMVNSNLRLVVSNARKYQGSGCL